MNFIKNTVKKATNGVELETLKFERGNLKDDIRQLKEKIAIVQKKTTLKTTLIAAMEDIKKTITEISPECNIECVFSEEPSRNEITPNPIEYTYKDCLRISYRSLFSSYNDIKKIVESLEKELMLGTERYETEIEKNTRRIDDIEKRLTVLRAKGTL